MGNEDQLEGQWDKLKGNVKEGIGDATDNERMQREGQMDQTKGNVKEGIGNVKEGIDDAVDDVKDFNR